MQKSNCFIYDCLIKGERYLIIDMYNIFVDCRKNVWRWNEATEHDLTAHMLLYNRSFYRTRGVHPPGPCMGLAKNITRRWYSNDPCDTDV